jgi:dolichyl-phosphate-mannose--protein O-mannosyl transferase
MLRPVAYWLYLLPNGDVATIWGAGNPLLWWAVIPAMMITAVRALQRPDVTREFLVIGYLAYFVVWIPITRILFLYHYMPSVYIGYLALAGLLADFWNGEARKWETLTVLFTMFPVLMVGLGHIAVATHPWWIPLSLLGIVGMPPLLIMVFVYLVLSDRPRLVGRFVVVVFLATALLLFLYYFPVWVGLPITRSGYYARMWLEGPGLQNWI